MNHLQATNKGYLYALAAVVIWTGFILVSRMGGISELLSYDVIAIRYATCAALLLPVWWFKYRFNLLNWKLVVASVIGGLAYALFAFRGFQLAPASHAAVLLPGLMPLFIILLSVWINRERQSWSKWLGIGVITLGVGSLFAQQLSQSQGLNQSQGQSFAEGHIWLVLAALMWALFSVLIKRWGITPWQATVSLAVITCALYLPVYMFWLPKNISTDLWPDILLQAFYQGIMATIVQMFLYVKAVQVIGPSSMGAMMAMVPVLAGVAAMFALNEPATPELLSGLVLVSVGAWVAHSQWLQTKYKPVLIND
ncbi:DMT family transporter [Maricurvus nonylphenolicus]|uniref:DMT family transporter n=1 Tax=Maricurvus nonylphenolicus TaxID=1008307 RepID=UPI0036F3C929